ncbi:hypothetical protein TYRP_003586 [Tyrophagus putrescentiae]|nr:hypothetical protein TYRP_003586 [Tyrophagus putrescentiae]
MQGLESSRCFLGVRALEYMQQQQFIQQRVMLTVMVITKKRLQFTLTILVTLITLITTFNNLYFKFTAVNLKDGVTGSKSTFFLSTSAITDSE